MGLRVGSLISSTWKEMSHQPTNPIASLMISRPVRIVLAFAKWTDVAAYASMFSGMGGFDVVAADRSLTPLRQPAGANDRTRRYWMRLFLSTDLTKRRLTFEKAVSMEGSHCSTIRSQLFERIKPNGCLSRNTSRVTKSRKSCATGFELKPATRKTGARELSLRFSGG